MKLIAQLSKFMFCLLLFTATSSCIRKVENWQVIREENAKSDIARFHENLTVPNQEMTLPEILAYALNRNIDMLVKQMQNAIQEEIEKGERLKMLPSLSLSGEISGRTETRGSISQPLTGANPPSGGSISRERTTKTTDLALAWNLVDFGLSYYSAKRESNKTHIQKLQYERARQNLILDVIEEYWRTIIAKEAMIGSKDLIDIAEKNQQNLQEQVSRRLVPEIQGLQSENQLIEIQMRLQAFRNQYYTSRAKLSSLMGLPPGALIALAPYKMHSIDTTHYDIEKLEEIALESRSELFVQDIEGEILANDVRATLIEMLPGVNLFAGHYRDDDRFIIQNNWFSAGVRASWDLLSIPALNSKKKALKLQKDQLNLSRMALSMGVLTQLHLADLEFKESISQHNLTQDLDSVKRRILDVSRHEHGQGLIDDVAIFNHQINALYSRINMIRSYATMHLAQEKISNSVGRPLLFYPLKGEVQSNLTIVNSTNQEEQKF